MIKNIGRIKKILDNGPLLKSLAEKMKVDPAVLAREYEVAIRLHEAQTRGDTEQAKRLMTEMVAIQKEH